MAGVFDLELHDEDNVHDSDDDIIEIDNVSIGGLVGVFSLFAANVDDNFQPSLPRWRCPSCLVSVQQAAAAVGAGRPTAFASVT